ncbi:MAG: Mov34/MPN/PAD-1 family protein [Firmicutes bacterium]|nr:Mov34/MPN/PAD-1 family protein [Bacillota bacterium]
MSGQEGNKNNSLVREKESLRILEAYKADFGEPGEKNFPGGDIKPFANEFRVYIEKKVYKDIIDHSFENDKIELGGVLIGDVKKDEHGAYLHITANIRGKYANSTISQITFTQDTWTHINNIKDKDYPNEKVVGWYHTHPGFGVFLSEMDMFIHENFFGNPYQVAFVVDPKDESEGLFIKRDDKIIMLERFWVKKDEHKCTQTQTEKEALHERFDKLEKRLKELTEALPGLEEAKGGGLSLFGMMGWMLAIAMMVLLLLQGMGIVGGKKAMVSTVENPIRNNEVLIYSENDPRRGVTVRVYAAPLTEDNVILPRHAEKGSLPALNPGENTKPTGKPDSGNMNWTLPVTTPEKGVNPSEPSPAPISGSGSGLLQPSATPLDQIKTTPEKTISIPLDKQTSTSPEKPKTTEPNFTKPPEGSPVPVEKGK